MDTKTSSKQPAPPPLTMDNIGAFFQTCKVRGVHGLRKSLRRFHFLWFGMQCNRYDADDDDGCRFSGHTLVLFGRPENDCTTHTFAPTCPSMPDRPYAVHRFVGRFPRRRNCGTVAQKLGVSYVWKSPMHIGRHRRRRRRRRRKRATLGLTL